MRKMERPDQERSSGNAEFGQSVTVVVVGSVNMDIVNRVERFPRPGETMRGRGAEYGEGGKGANQAVAAALAGARTTFIGAVGTDAFGEPLRKGLMKRGVRTDRLVDKQGSSGLAFITVNDAGENHIIVSEGSNGKLLREDVERDALAEADWVLLQNEIPWDVNDHVLRLCDSLGVRTLYNPAPARPLPEYAYRLIDTLILNESEAEALTGIAIQRHADARTASRRLVERGVRNVILTMGTEGSLYSNDRGGSLATPAFKVPVVDTTAAGDTFIGAYASAFGIDERIEEALTFASAAAAIAVTRQGAQTSIPAREETVAFMKAQTT